jgi:hypothetical protein
MRSSVGGDAITLEINLPSRVKRELKGLILFLTRWSEASAEFVLLSKAHEYSRLRDHTTTYPEFKQGHGC